MNSTTAKFWEGRTPTPEYFAPVNPYEDPPSCKYDLQELTRYARQVGKRIVELTYEEISHFSV